MTARSLELIYTVADWPPGAKTLSKSLKDLGKSRADLWQFAGNWAMERAINASNEAGVRFNATNGDAQVLLCAIEGRENCKMRLDRTIPFKTGRRDCIPDPSKKWTPYEFEATKEERHFNSHGTGIQGVKDMKRDFNLTARETIALYALHGLARFGRSNHEEMFKYRWIGGSADGYHYRRDTKTFSNIYHKTLNGRTYQRGGTREQLYKNMPGYWVGDANGDPVGKSGWRVFCQGYWKTPGRYAGGPCIFRPSRPGCVPKDNNPDHVERQFCFDRTKNGDLIKKGWWGCNNATLIEKDGFLYQKGGPPLSEYERCYVGWQFAMNFELGLVVDFQVDPVYNVPIGCGNLNSSWIKTR